MADAQDVVSVEMPAMEAAVETPVATVCVATPSADYNHENPLRPGRF